MSRLHRDRSSSWDPVAHWYIGWVGKRGSSYHRRIAIPAVLDLLQLEPGEHVIDIGCGPGVLAPHIADAGCRYTGVDASARLVRYARKHHKDAGIFLHGDATRLATARGLQPSSCDAAVFLLSIQDISPLAAAIESAAWVLGRPGRIVILMTHPCFRVPWHSGWAEDPHRRLVYRRIERYRNPFSAPMKEFGGSRRGATRTYHRPLQAYVNRLATHDLVVDRLIEIGAGDLTTRSSRAGSREVDSEEIPLFLGLRAVTH